jgi:hypothetical protein
VILQRVSGPNEQLQARLNNCVEVDFEPRPGIQILRG